MRMAKRPSDLPITKGPQEKHPGVQGIQDG
jgi:hypothetical protein